MAKQRLVKKGSQYGILDEASNTVLPISENMKLVQKQGRYGILDGNSVIPIDDFSESISDSDLDILKKKKFYGIRWSTSSKTWFIGISEDSREWSCGISCKTK